MTKPKGFAKPKPVIQERRFWLEQKRYFPRDGSDLDRGWVKLNLRVIDAPGILHSADWDNLMMRVRLSGLTPSGILLMPKHQLKCQITCLSMMHSKMMC